MFYVKLFSELNFSINNLYNYIINIFTIYSI